jgi:release factor glutamine methyltransferase
MCNAIDSHPSHPEAQQAQIESAARRLDAAGIETARLDAEILMAAACGGSRSEVIAGLRLRTSEAVERFRRFISRREKREPLPYIVGHREFYSLNLIVSPAVLIPRPETEAIVDAALAVLSKNPKAHVLDLGTGSGCIALAIAANASCARIVATDVSAAALEIARLNAERLGLSDRVDFRCGDLFDAVDRARFDLIVSNPPYVEEAAALEPEISRFEPPVALYAGADGLEFYRRMAGTVRDHLEPGGNLIVEVGAGQAEPVADLLRKSGAVEILIGRDLAGISRVVRAQFA